MDIKINVVIYILTIDLLAIMSPGPDFFMVLKNSLTKSHKAGLYTTLGIALGSGIMFTAVLFGVQRFVEASEWIFLGIKIIGSLYLLYLAFKAIFAEATIYEPQLVYSEGSKVNKLECFKIGLICNLTNPKSFMFMVSLSAYAVSEGAKAIDNWIIVVVSTGLTILWFSLVAIVFGSAKLRKIFYSKGRIINICFGLFLIYIAAEIMLI